MAQRELGSVVRQYNSTVRECRRLANDARQWSLPGSPLLLTTMRRDSLIELAFLRGFLAWESFLEESFVLYLLGKNAPRGRPPRRFAMPPTRSAAQLFVAEGREHTKWDVASASNRAERFFAGGRPFAGPLRSNQSHLSDAGTIRNAVAHKTPRAREKFEALVRRELGALPPNMTVGGFLNTTKPSSIPLLSYLEFYLDRTEFIAKQIVPT